MFVKHWRTFAFNCVCVIHIQLCFNASYNCGKISLDMMKCKLINYWVVLDTTIDEYSSQNINQNQTNKYTNIVANKLLDNIVSLCQNINSKMNT